MDEELKKENTHKETSPKKKMSIGKEIFQIGIFALIIFAFKSSFLGNFTVPTGSMEPNIMPGDKLIADMRCYNIRIPFTSISLWKVADPEVGDIVVFDYPKDRWTNYVKRLVGKPGDVLEVRDGFIIRNGEPFTSSPNDPDFLEEILQSGGEYQESNGIFNYTVQRKPHDPMFADDSDLRTFVIPEGHYFFMGDNRDQSSDSRVWGFVPADHIRGKAKFVYYSSDSEPGWFTLPKRIRYERIGTVLK